MTGRAAARAAAAAGAVILLAAGCGTAHGSGPHGVSRLIAAGSRAPAGGGPANGGSAGGRASTGPPVIGPAQAWQLARALLARAAVPPGARPWSGRLPAALATAAGMQAGRPSAGLHRLWGLAEPAAVADVFETRHVPAGMAWDGSGQGSDRGTMTDESVSYRLRQLPAGVVAAGLTMTVAPAGPNASVLRADAQVIWYPRRSTAEYLPASMHAVTVTVTVSGSRPRTVTKTITSPSVVRQLAAMLNGVHAAPSGAFVSCPVFLASYRIAFAVSSGAAPYLVASANTCPDVAVTAAGRRQPALETPDGLLPLLHRLTGVAAQPGGGGPVTRGKPGPSIPAHSPLGTPPLMTPRPVTPRLMTPRPWNSRPAPWVSSVPRD